MKSILKSVAVIALWVAASPLHAADGVLIVEKTTSGGTTQTSQIQMEKDRMRAESAGASGEKQTIVFDGSKQVLWIINDDKKTYSEMTKADADRLGGQLTDAMAKMQEQLKNLPPEQRAQVEAMMKGRGGMPGRGGAQAPSTAYRKAGTDKVGKWTCDKYEGFQNNQKTSEICTVDPKVLGFSAADFEVSRRLAEFFKTLMPQNADRMFSLGKSDEQSFEGVPVRRVFSIGPRQITTELSDVSRATFPASTFEVPAGFRKEAIGGRGQ